MGNNTGTYTVELAPSIKGVMVLGYREKGCRKRTGVKFIPWKLAYYLCLMPNDKRWGEFKDVLYDFSCGDLREFKGESPEVKKVTRKKTRVFVTVDLSKV